MHPNQHDSIIIPPPLLVVIEDVGWWSGYSRPETNEPYRSGLGRMHAPEDYAALIRLARLLKTQIIAGFVLCEWDRKGILRDCPSATWMGSLWQGSTTGIELQDQVVSLLNKHPECICMALHGVGHEYWDRGMSSRTEFHDAEGIMRDAKEVKTHITLFGKLFESSGIHTSFPQIFIPPALKHSVGNGSEGIQKILSTFGIKFVFTVFDKTKQYAPPMFPGVTEECGVILIERGPSPVNWDQVSAKPLFSFEHPVIPLHWANILHKDPYKNNEVVDAWAEYLAEGVRRNGFICFPDVMSAVSQIVFNRLTRIISDGKGIIFDISDVRRVFSDHIQKGFHVLLPETATICKKDGTLEQAGHIRERLMKLIPAPFVDHIRIYHNLS